MIYDFNNFVKLTVTILIIFIVIKLLVNTHIIEAVLLALIIAASIYIAENLINLHYIDSDSEIDYMLEQDPTKIDELASSIIDNPECIDHVLSSDMFENQKIDLLDSWLEIANNEQFENIRAYVEECDDPTVKEWLKNILSDIEEI